MTEETFDEKATEAAKNSPAPGKYFMISKGFVFGLLTLLFAIAILFAEVEGVDAWDLEHWNQWIKAVGAGIAILSASGSLYGRVVATAPIRFS